jgi:hypothetical protein
MNPTTADPVLALHRTPPAVHVAADTRAARAACDGHRGPVLAPFNPGATSAPDLPKDLAVNSRIVGWADWHRRVRVPVMAASRLACVKY